MYFFIDPAQLPEKQNIEDTFGPINNDLTNKYSVTSKFQLTTEAKAFACEKGMMVVQQSSVDDSLVNVIIKPNSSLKVTVDVKYYIYRGILKSSLIGLDSCIITQDHTNNELIARIWLDPPTEPDCGTIGYMDNSDTTPLSEDIERIFDYDIASVNPILVKEGEWFGMFTKDHKIGFEIVLRNNRFKATLEYVRSGGYEIDVTGLTGYTQRIKREEILNFIDPAAFFGMHYKEKVSYYDPTASNNTRKTNTTPTSSRFIYTKLISKFYTKNMVYLDIRSEKGYSYNFYQNYKVSLTDVNNIKIRRDTSFTTEIYHTSNWPILILESTHTSGTTNNLRVNLRIDDNLKPIIYTKTNLKKSLSDNNSIKSKYIKTLSLVDNGNNPDHTDWTNEFRLFFPNTQSGTSRNYISNYVKLYYFRGCYNSTSVSPVLINEHYYDSAFCSVDIPNIGTTINNKRFVESANPIYVREPNNTDGTGNFQLNMTNGAYWDNERILFYGVIEYENSEEVSEKEYLNTYSQKFDFDSCSFFNEYCDSELYKRTEIICREYTTTDGTVRIPGINFYKSEKKGIKRNYKENAMLLGLTLAELRSIKSNSQIDLSHHRFIHLVPKPNSPVTNNSIKHFEYELQLQGLNSNGERIIVTPQHNGATITLYSRDNQFFSSRAFSTNIPLTTGQNGQNQTNRVEFHIYHDGVIKINDNIDFALIHDIQNAYYLYHDSNNNIHEVTNLHLLLINKMGIGQSVSSVPAGHTSTIDYTPYNSDDVNAKTSYIYPNGDVITEGLKYGQSLYKIKYKKLDKRGFLANLTAINFATLSIEFEYVGTRRFYCKPEVVAVFIGALVEVGAYTDAATTIDFIIKSTGSCFEDGTSFPSVEHNNGNAIDTKYQNGISGLTNAQALARDQIFVDGMSKFGCTKILRGTGSHYSTGLTTATNGGSLHNTHLHSGKVVLKDGNKAL